ncbi:NAD(+)/NADH kinase [Alicyclobacillus ferrooxydans]|uniref:NAD kinase n=1 Tax=Alicyclobacillus ferrooxydans TaxID=471514 RepID=A0A0P9CCD0_9BACL|nr:NAD(+)/NADH kinase [Alicyclobacillus ferrooxydans]KPV43265.1 inorganic polyphosphate kinase [Alicyclobacillus ferrooxydans]
MRTVGVLVNQDKPGADDTKQRLCQLLSQHGFAQVTATTDELAADTVTGKAFQGAELIFVLGGDGTLLGAARKLVDFKVPLLGINLGHLGFLSEADPGNLQETVRRVVEREYDLEQRLALCTHVIRENGDSKPHFIGINDVAIGKGSFARMVTVEVYVDDVLLDSYRGDGVLVSTPTGSTAYSLSCGGPIVVPYAKAILITPICPHTLVSRPCVIDSSQTIRLVVRGPQDDVGLTVDGQVGFPLVAGDEVTVERSPVDVTLVKWRDREFFSVLRKKLRYGDQSV